MLKRILVALSGTPYTPIAVEHAVELAQRFDAEVTGVTVTDFARLANVGPVPIGAGAAAAQLAESRIHVTEERVHDAIADFESAASAAGITARVERETCNPLDELMSLWRYNDLTIIGLRGLFEYGVVHNPDDKLLSLIKHGVRPILAVGKRFHEIKRVFVAYNGSMESAKAMKRFAQMNLWPDPAVKIACYDAKPEVGRALLDEAAAYHRLYDLEPETDLVDAPPKDRLLQDAHDWGADLIVLGSTKRMRLFQHVLGDMVLHLVRESDIPLFLTQ